MRSATLRKSSNGSFHLLYRRGIIILYDDLNTGLNEKGLMKGRLMNKKRYLAVVGIIATAMLLLASSCNSRPVIIGLEAETPGWTAPLGSLQVTCNVSDQNGDVLSYSWSANGGNITGTGAIVNWIAPGEVGMYDIAVVVDDGHGEHATGMIALTASNGPPPTIENVIVTANGNPYLKKTTTGYKVGKAYNYTIECIALGNGTLSYNWTCTAGGLSGEGYNITWTAPNTEGGVIVTVKVFDGIGNWVRESIVFTVVHCVSCEWWT
jgi:hypothetical protein